MAVTMWGTASSWTLTASPLFIWMGEILFRTRLSESMFRGLAPWVNALPGRLLHTNVIGCTIFAAVSGSSAATCAIEQEHRLLYKVSGDTLHIVQCRYHYKKVGDNPTPARSACGSAVPSRAGRAARESRRY